jgi:hypothetical protein
VTLNPLYAMAGAAVFVFAAPAAYRLSRERRWRSTALLFAGAAILSFIAAMPVKNELQLIQVIGALIVGCLWAVIISWLSRRQLELPLQVRRDPKVYLWITALFLPLLLCFLFFTTPILGLFGPVILLFIYFTNGVRYLVLVSAILAAAGIMGTLAASFTSIPWQTKAKLWAISMFAAATLIQLNVRF